MKRVLCIALILCCFVSAICVSSAAETAAVEPRLVGISRIGANLTINNYGKANCIGLATAVSGYSVTVIMELQRDGVTVKSWEESGTTIVMDEDYYVTHGYDYQVITTARVKTAGGLYLCSYTSESDIVHY